MLILRSNSSRWAIRLSMSLSLMIILVASSFLHSYLSVSFSFFFLAASNFCLINKHEISPPFWICALFARAFYECFFFKPPVVVPIIPYRYIHTCIPSLGHSLQDQRRWFMMLWSPWAVLELCIFGILVIQYQKYEEPCELRRYYT